MPLFKRRVRSALYIDFENFRLQAPALTNVIAWLEDGMFDKTRRKRKLVQRRLYLNSQQSKHRQSFEAIGFEVIEVEHYGGLHNGADIRIAVDMIEATFLDRKIDEFVLFSLDSDFVPLVQKLGARGKRTVMLVDEWKPVAKTAFDLHADETIAKRILTEEAAAYVRPRRSFFSRRPTKTVGAPDLAAKTATAAPAAEMSPAKPSAKPLPSPPPPRPPSPKPAARTRTDTAAASAVIPQAAIDAFIRVAARNVGQPTARTSINKELMKLDGFSFHGRAAYFGTKSYNELAKAISRLDNRIEVKTVGLSGISVTYVPRASDASLEPKTEPALQTLAPHDDRPSPVPTASEPATTTEAPS